MTERRPGTHLLLVTPDPSHNSLGRTYCLWLLAQHLGWETTLVSVAGEVIWEPLRGTPFGDSCIFIDRARPGWRDRLADHVAAADVVIAVKPLPSSLGVVHGFAERAGTPLIVDVDDPDVEVRTIWRPLYKRVPRRLLQPAYQDLIRMGKIARRLPTLVSNPVLQEIYGGLIVPHVRPAIHAPQPARYTSAPVVRFVGSPKAHKGLDLLRAAIGEVVADGYSLEVTADAPPDAAPWERWLGRTSFDEGQELASTADVIVIPSLVRGWAPAQLPAKLIDAMMFGRPVVASDIPPVRWALGGTGRLFEPGDVAALVNHLRALRNPGLRTELGLAAHARALTEFSVEAVATPFGAYVDSLIDRADHARARVQTT